MFQSLRVQPDILGWKVAMTILDTLAISSSVFRISVRWNSSKLWWDDYVVFFPLTVEVYYMITLWTIPLFTVSNVDESLKVNFLVTTLPPILIIWIPRSVLALGLVRIFPRGTFSRRSYLALACFFAFMCTASVTSMCINCFLGNKGTHARFPTCSQGPSSAFTVPLLIFLVVDVASDLLLVVCPLYMFWRAKLLPAEKRMILITLSCSIITCTIVLVFIAMSATPSPSPGVIVLFSHLEAAVSLLVCNLMVVVSFAFRTITKWKVKRLELHSAQGRDVPLAFRTPRAATSDTNSMMFRSDTIHSSTRLTDASPGTSGERETPTVMRLTQISSQMSERTTGVEFNSAVFDV